MFLRPEAGRRDLPHAVPVVGHHQAQLVAGRDRSLTTWVALGVLAHVGERLAQDRQHLLGQLPGHHLVHRAAEGHLWDGARAPVAARAPDRGPWGAGPSLLMVSSMSKIALRSWRMVSSSLSMASPMRMTASGRSTRRAVPWSESPMAKRRWMTESCRSRAIRSRSSVKARSRTSDHGAARSRWRCRPPSASAEHELLVVLGELRRARACWSGRDCRRPRRAPAPAHRGTTSWPGWCGRHAEAVRAGGDVGQPERLVVGDERAQHAPPVGRGPIACSSSPAEAHGDELVEGAARPRSAPRAPRTAASTRSQASSTIRRRTTGRLSSASRIRMAWTRRRSLAGSSIRSNGCTARQDRRGAHACGAPACGASGRHDVTSGSRVAVFDQMSIRVFLLDDHELVRTGLRTLLEAEDDMEVVGEAGTAEQGLEADPRSRARRRHPRRPPPRRQRDRGVPRDPVDRAPGPLPHAHVVLRRRRPLLLDHGGRIGLRPQGDRQRRPPGRHPPGQPGHVPPRSRC